MGFSGVASGCNLMALTCSSSGKSVGFFQLAVKEKSTFVASAEVCNGIRSTKHWRPMIEQNNKKAIYTATETRHLYFILIQNRQGVAALDRRVACTGKRRRRRGVESGFKGMHDFRRSGRGCNPQVSRVRNGRVKNFHLWSRLRGRHGGIRWRLLKGQQIAIWRST